MTKSYKNNVNDRQLGLFYYNLKLKNNEMDTLGIEPNTSRMLSERDNQLHHVPVKMRGMFAVKTKWSPFTRPIETTVTEASFKLTDVQLAEQERPMGFPVLCQLSHNNLKLSCQWTVVDQVLLGQ